MTLNAAIKQLSNECAFLGIHWDRLIYMCRYNPMMFPQSTMEAYKVWLKSEGNVIEEGI